MMLPTVHLNGTSKGELLQQLCDANSALSAALRALAEAAPNGRDYYPQGADAIGKAITEHTARLQAIKNVQKEILAIAEHVDP